MNIRELFIAVGVLTASSCAVGADCDAALTASLDAAQRLADSVRADKPGLARVCAADGTEFTAGQALWLKGQLRGAQRACARGQPSDAATELTAARALIEAHSFTRRQQPGRLKT